MALLLMDGFDWGNNGAIAPTYGWVSTGVILVYATGGRFNGGTARLRDPTSSYLNKSIDPSSNVVGIFFAFYNSTTPTTRALVALNNTNYNYGGEVLFGLNSAGYFEVRRGTTVSTLTGSGTVIGTSNNSYNWTVWHIVEIEVKLATDTTGYVKVWIDGKLEINESGVQTTVSNTTMKYLYTGCASAAYTYFDDIVVWDDSGSSFNTMPIGDMRVRTLHPDADSGTPQWTPLTGTTNYDQVDEAALDNDTTYVYSTTTGDVDQYSLGTVPSVSSVYAARAVMAAKKGDASDSTLYLNVVNGTSTSTSSAQNTPASYFGLEWLLPQDPVTGTSWVTSDVNSITIGPQSGGV